MSNRAKTKGNLAQENILGHTREEYKSYSGVEGFSKKDILMKLMPQNRKIIVLLTFKVSEKFNRSNGYCQNY